MALRRTVEPATEPVTLAEAKAHMRIDHSNDDAWITAAIVEAREMAEKELGRSLITQTWQRTLDYFPDAIELSYPPIIAVSSILYRDSVTGTPTVLSAASYEVDSASEPGYVVPAYGYEWPTPQDSINAVTVTYTAGYGDASAVPQAIKKWMLMIIGHMDANREATVPGVSIVKTPYLDGLLDRYRIVMVA